MQPLRHALVRLSIDDQPTEDLPAMAAVALSAGVDSPSLRLLAGTSSNDVRDARDLFVTAMAELDVELPSHDEGLRALVRYWAAEIVAGTVTPIEGARLIWWRGYEELGRPDDLTPFVGLASEWEDDPPHRGQYDSDIIAQANRLILDEG